MSETPKSQTQTQPKILQIVKKKIIEPSVICEVPRSIYRILRSFVESSNKPEYIWNIGRRINENTVMFEKPEMWTLTVYADDNNVNVELCDTKNNTVMEYRDGKIVIEEHVFDVISVYDDEMQMLVAFMPALRKPYDRPVTLHEIVKRLKEYVRI